MRSFIRCVVVAAVCAATSPAVRADRSRITDEVDVIEFGDCEIEAAVERKRLRGAPRERQSALAVNCGVGAGTELALIAARTRSSDGREDEFGLEGVTALRERADGRVGWNLLYGIARQRERPGRWRSGERFVALEATYQPAERWFVDAVLGAARDPIARQDKTLWLVGAEFAFSETVEARVELGGDDRHRPLAGAALRFVIWPETALLTIGYAQSSGHAREKRLGASVTFEF